MNMLIRHKDTKAQRHKVSPLIVASVFFLNQINLSAAGVLDLINEPQKNYEEMISDDQNADLAISNLNAVIGATGNIVEGLVGNLLTLSSEVLATKGYTRFVGSSPNGTELNASSQLIGLLNQGATLIFYDPDGRADDGDISDDKLVSVVLPDSIAGEFTNVIRHASTGLESYTLDGDGNASKTFSDSTKLDMQAAAGVRTYSITAGESSNNTTMRLKDGSNISMLRGAFLGNMTFNNAGGGFDAAVVAASKGTINWKKKTDITLSQGAAGDIVIKGGSSFTTVDGKFLASNQGTITLGIGSSGVFDLGDGTRITAAAADNLSITIKNGQWDLSNFQGDIQLGNMSGDVNITGMKLTTGEAIKLTASSNASFTLSAIGTINTNLSNSKGALTFTLPDLNADTIFTLQAARGPGVDGKLGTGDDVITTMDLTALNTNSLTQFTIENAKFKSSTKGELTLALPATYEHVLKVSGEPALKIVADGRENNINDRGISFANGLRFIYDNQGTSIAMTINPNGKYSITGSGIGANKTLVVVANAQADFAEFDINDVKVTPKYKTGGSFGINTAGEVDVVLSNLNESDTVKYDRRKLEIQLPSDGNLELAGYTIKTSQTDAKLLVKNSAVDFENTTGEFEIDISVVTNPPQQFLLKDKIAVEAIGTGPVRFDINSGKLTNLNLSGQQTGKIKISLAAPDAKTIVAPQKFDIADGVQVTLGVVKDGGSFFTLNGGRLEAEIKTANYSGEISVKAPSLTADLSFNLFERVGSADNSVGAFVIRSGSSDEFKLTTLKFDRGTPEQTEDDQTAFMVTSIAGTLEFTLNSAIALTIAKDITVTRNGGNATFDLINGKLNFSARNAGNTTLTLGQNAAQTTITQSDNSELTVGPGAQTINFINGKINDSSIHVLAKASRRMAGGVTFTNNSADTELVIGNSNAQSLLPTDDTWDFATEARFPAAAVTVQVTNASEMQTFELRSSQNDTNGEIIITIAQGQSASFKVNADGTFGGYLSGEFAIEIKGTKSLVLGTLTIGDTPASNVTLLANAGLTNLAYSDAGINLANFTGNVTLTNAPASKFTFAATSDVSSMEAQAGAAFTFEVGSGIPEFAALGSITVKDKTKVTLTNSNVVLVSDGGEATLTGNVIDGTGKLTVTNNGSGAATFTRTNKFDLTANASSGFTVDLSNNDNLSSLSGGIALVASAALRIDSVQGAVNITTNGNDITLNGATFNPTNSENISVNEARVDLKTFDGAVTFNGSISAMTYILRGAVAEPDIEFMSNTDFTVTSGVLNLYVNKNKFTLRAKDVLKLGDMTFEATGISDVTISGSGDNYAFSATGDVKVSVTNASAIKTFELNGMQFKVETTKNAVFTVASGNLSKYESGDITVTKLNADPITINGVQIEGAQSDQFRLSNGKFDLTVPSAGIIRTAALSVTANESATFLLKDGIELTAKPVTSGEPPVTTPSVFSVNNDGGLNLSFVSGNFTLTLPKDVIITGLSGLSNVTAKNGPATFDMTGNIADLQTLKGSLEVTITNSTPINLLNNVSITAPTSNATVLLANGNLNTYVSGRAQIQMAETTTEVEGTPDTTIKFAASSVFGADSQVLYRKGAAGSLVIDSATSQIDFGTGTGIFEVKLKGTGTVVPKVVLMNAEITPIVVGPVGAERWLAEMIIKDKKLATTRKGDLEVRITNSSFKFKMLDNTKVNGPAESKFRINNGRYAGLISLPAGLIAGSGFRIELGSIITHSKNIDADPENEYEVKYIQNTKLEYLNMTDLPDVLNTDTEPVPGIAILKALEDIVIDGLGLVPANGIMVFKNNNIVLQSDEYYYALRVE